MSLTCNINRTGRVLRLLYGLLLIVAGVLMLVFWANPTGGWLAWIVSTVCVLGGVFAVFEAANGWCVMRAMGIKTPW